MYLSACVVAALCIAAQAYSYDLELTDAVRSGLNATLKELFNRLNSNSGADTSLALVNIQRVVVDANSDDLHITAIVNPIPDACTLILREDASKRLEIDCNGRKWNVIEEALTRKRRDADGEWREVERFKWDQLRAVINRGLARLDRHQFQSISNIYNIHEKDNKYVIEGVIEYPRQPCSFILEEVPEAESKLKVTCRDDYHRESILETTIPAQARRKRQSHQHHSHQHQQHQHNQHERGQVETEVHIQPQGNRESAHANTHVVGSQALSESGQAASGTGPMAAGWGLTNNGPRAITGNDLSQLNVKINDILKQLESEQGARLTLIRIQTAQRQAGTNPHYLVRGEFSGPSTPNVVCNLEIREDLSNRNNRDSTLTCGQNTYRVTRGSGQLTSGSGHVIDGARNVVGDDLFQLNVKVNDILLQIEKERGARLGLIRIQTAQRQAGANPHYLVRGEFAVPPAANVVCDMEILEDLSNRNYRDSRLTCAQNTYRVTRGSGRNIEVL